MTNKLKILLGNNTLALLAGSETWTQTLARELKKMGHEVSCFSPTLGIISDQLKKDGIESYADVTTSGVKPFSILLEEKKDFNFDLIIANHHHIVTYLRKQFPTTPIISTIHGILHKMNDEHGQEVDAPEHPALEARVDQFVSVSEEVQEMLQKQYNLDSVIVRNFFDTDYYNAKRPISEKPQLFLINTNYYGSKDPETELIRTVAKHYGARLAGVGMNFQQSDDMMKGIEEADVVVGMGRSVLEGVCAGRLGIVNGRWGTGGVVHEGSVETLRSFNFSGRNSGGRLMTPEELIAEIDEHYNPKTIQWGKTYVRSQHNVAFAAEQFIQLGRGFLNMPVEEVQSIKKYRRQRDAS